MVAITVILAAVIAAFVLDLGDTSEAAQANFDVSQDDGDLIVQVTNSDRIDGYTILFDDQDCEISTGDDYDFSVGSTVSIDMTDLGNGDIEISGDDCDSDDDVANSDRELQFVFEYDGDEQLGPSFDWEAYDSTA